MLAHSGTLAAPPVATFATLAPAFLAPLLALGARLLRCLRRGHGRAFRLASLRLCLAL